MNVHPVLSPHLSYKQENFSAYDSDGIKGCRARVGRHLIISSRCWIHSMCPVRCWGRGHSWYSWFVIKIYWTSRWACWWVKTTRHCSVFIFIMHCSCKRYRRQLGKKSHKSKHTTHHRGFEYPWSHHGAKQMVQRSLGTMGTSAHLGQHCGQGLEHVRTHVLPPWRDQRLPHTNYKNGITPGNNLLPPNIYRTVQLFKTGYL